MGEVPPSLPSPTGVLALSQSHSGCLSHAQTPCRPRGLAVNTVPAWSGHRSVQRVTRLRARPAFLPRGQSRSSAPGAALQRGPCMRFSRLQSVPSRCRGGRVFLPPPGASTQSAHVCVRVSVWGGGTAAPSLQEGQPSQDSPCCRPHGVLQSGPALTQHVSSQILLILPY